MDIPYLLIIGGAMLTQSVLLWGALSQKCRSVPKVSLLSQNSSFGTKPKIGKHGSNEN